MSILQAAETGSGKTGVSSYEHHVFASLQHHTLTARSRLQAAAEDSSKPAERPAMHLVRQRSVPLQNSSRKSRACKMGYIITICHLTACLHTALQAFALPVLQIVHETLQSWARGAAIASNTSSDSSSSSRRCELSVEDRDSFFSIKDGVLGQCRQERSWGGARATWGAFAGKVYYEVTSTFQHLT